MNISDVKQITNSRIENLAKDRQLSNEEFEFSKKILANNKAALEAKGGLRSAKSELASLPYDVYKRIDATVKRNARSRLNILPIADALGLIRTLSLGDMEMQVQFGSEVTKANVSMNGNTRAEQDDVDYKQVNISVPMQHKEFQVGVREIIGSEQRGTSVKNVAAERNARVVAEAMEDQIILGSNVSLSGKQTYGIVNHPNVKNVTGVTNWSLSATTGDQIYAGYTKMYSALFNAGYEGDKLLILPNSWYSSMIRPFSAQYDGMSVIERIMGSPGLVGVVNSSRLVGTYANTPVLLELSPDTFEVLMGADITTAEFANSEPMNVRMMIYAAVSAGIYPDTENGVGIAVGTV